MGWSPGSDEGRPERENMKTLKFENNKIYSTSTLCEKADIFEIVPTTPYDDDYDTVVDLAQEEQRNNARPAISGSIENMEQYDVIYVGFPNWWGDMPMILYTFFDTYDLSGKTVALFCTSGGSGLSNTVNEVKSLEPNATVTEGLHIGSGSSSNPDKEVSEWLNDIGLAK